jgi:hypothetical protein
LTTNSEILTEDKEPFLQPWQFFLLGGMLAATATVIVATGQSPAVLSSSTAVVSIALSASARTDAVAAGVDQPETPMTIGGRTRVALEREDCAPIDQGTRVRFRDGQDRKGGLRRNVGQAACPRARLDAPVGCGRRFREQIAKEVEGVLPIRGPLKADTWSGTPRALLRLQNYRTIPCEVLQNCRAKL